MDRRAVRRQTLLQLGILGCRDKGVVEFAHDSIVGPSRRREPDPARNLFRTEAEFGERRHFRHFRSAFVRVDRQNLDFLFAIEALRDREGRQREIDAPGDQIGHHRRAATIMNILRRRAGRAREPRCEEMGWRPHPRRAEAQSAVLAFAIGQQLAHRIRRTVSRHGDEGDEIEQQRHRRKALDRIELNFLDRRDRGLLRPEEREQRITVRRRILHGRRRHRAAASGAVLHHDALSQPLRHRFGENPRGHIGDPAGRDADDNRDRTGRIVLGNTRMRRQQRHQARNRTKPAFHGE